MSARTTSDTIAKQTLRSLELLEHVDAYGVPVAVLTSKDRYTVLAQIGEHAGDISTLDAAEVAAMLPAWSRWLQSLGMDDRVGGASISLESWAAGGCRATVAVSFTAAPIPGKDRRALSREQMLTSITTHLGRVLDGLRMASSPWGVGVCNAQDVTDTIRAAFDSTTAADIRAERAKASGTGLVWADAPPRPESTTATTYSHDRVVSTSWSMAARPDEHEIPAQVCTTALEATPGVLSKRATVIYRIAPTVAAKLAPFGLILTADVRAGEDASPARAIPTQYDLRTRLRLRPATYAQDTTFLAGLPLDLATPHTVMILRELKETA